MAQTCSVKASGGLCILLLSHDELYSYFFFALFKVLQKVNFKTTMPHIKNTQFVFQTQFEG